MVSYDYQYAAKASAGPERPERRWKMVAEDKIWTIDQARAAYERVDAGVSDWFAVIRVPAGADRPDALLEMMPRARGVTLHRLDECGRIKIAYSWITPDEGESGPWQRTDGERVFLAQIIWYSYPADLAAFVRRGQSEGLVVMGFRPDGYARQETVVRGGFDEPDKVDLQEFSGVDVSANWFAVPEFGDWEAFFEPEGDDED